MDNMAPTVALLHDGPFSDEEHMDLEQQRLHKQIDILNDDVATLRAAGRPYMLDVCSDGQLQLLPNVVPA
jgi:hypothetical protein